ncbi:MAG: homoserine dehydrogenase [Anaerolineae bacterium]|nr:MAG: homoserine dehydrogenase [Anaerolineae bacterium]
MLDQLQALDIPIRTVIVGAGAMGKGLLYQTTLTPGIQCVALADIRIERAVACADAFGLPYRIVETLNDLHAAIRTGALAVCEDGDLLARCELSDVFLESSNAILPAAQFALAALEHGQHLVLMNAEIDLIFGPYLMKEAHHKGLVYTSCDGDQHGVIKRLVDDLRLWGFELVMAGNIKGYLDRASDPTAIIPEADKRDLDYRMAAAYTDGTKLNIEMALVANALGCRTDVPGMHGPRAASVQDVFERFDLETLWRDHRPVVDYILGAQPDGGVFAIGWQDNAYQGRMLRYYKMGNGPFYLFYRPYHLCHVEAMACVADAALNGRSLLEPRHGLRTNVIAYAKTPLKAGKTLDGIGGYCCYGQIENTMDSNASPGLPICLADGVRLARDMAQGARIALADVVYDAQREDFQLFDRAQSSGR